VLSLFAAFLRCQYWLMAFANQKSRNKQSTKYENKSENASVSFTFRQRGNTGRFVTIRISDRIDR
jgi:hypothetical protein